MKLKHIVLFIFICLSFNQTMIAQKKAWIKRPSSPYNIGRPSFYFSYGNKIYIGKYTSNAIADSIFYFDKVLNSWGYLGQFPGTSHYSQAITAGTKAYIISGKSSITGPLSGNSFSKEVWEYDIPNNVWTQKSNFPGSGREDHRLLFDSTSNKIYLSFGANSVGLLDDLWSYNLNTYNFSQLSSFIYSSPSTFNTGARASHSFYKNGNTLIAFSGRGQSVLSGTNTIRGFYNITSDTWSATASGVSGANPSYDHVFFPIQGKYFSGLGGIGGSVFLAGTQFGLERYIYGFNFFNNNDVVYPAGTSQSAVGIECSGSGFVGLGFNRDQFFTITGNNNDWFEYTGFIIMPDNILVNANTTKTIKPLVNDTDYFYGFNKSTLNIVSNPLNGTYTVDTANRTILYTPNNNFIGIDSMKYTICNRNPSLSICDTANIKLTVSGVLQLNASNNYNDEEIELFPNPCSDYLVLKSSTSKINSIIIYNQLQKIVLRNETILNDNINVKQLEPGIYFMDCISNLSLRKFKFIKQ